MTVQELNVLHRRYVDLSDRFRAAWAFHQFLGSLRKIFLKGEGVQYPADFQEVYSDLKQVSANLNTSSVDLVREKLDRVEEQLGSLTWALLAEDNRVSPSYLRKFFQRVKNCDQKILTQLVKFYLYAREGGLWPEDRIDKIDFLFTRIASNGGRSGGGKIQDRKFVRELLDSLWGLLGEPSPGDEAVGEVRRAVDQMRGELDQVASLDALADRRIVPRYRDLKHTLGSLFFEPRIQLSVLDTNMALAELVQRLYAAEERRIIAEYQQIFELEREVPVDMQLDQELTRFHSEIERFERQLQNDELKLEDLARIRGLVRSLIPRLRGPSGDSNDGEAIRSLDVELPSVGDGSPEPAIGGDSGLLREHLARLNEALQASDSEADPRAVTLTTELYAFLLEGREVAAYRALADGAARSPELETFVLEGAALRSRINEEAAEIRDLMDDTVNTGESPLFAQARLTSRLADLYLRRYSHAIDQSVLASDLEEARQLQVLRMRLMRDYSGLWLLVHKPYRSGFRKT